MYRLDEAYIEEMVKRARTGDSNAFAEIFAATYERQYRFSLCYLQDETIAKQALTETYVQALNGLYRVKEETLFLPWLSQINFRVCYDKMSKLYDNHIIPYLLALPFSESQVLFLNKVNNMKIGAIANLLETNRFQVYRNLHNGLVHLDELKKKGGSL